MKGQFVKFLENIPLNTQETNLEDLTQFSKVTLMISISIMKLDIGTCNSHF